MPTEHTEHTEALALWKRQQAVLRRARNQGKGILGGRLNHKCRCACGLRFTTKGIAQHQRRCVVQQTKWGLPDKNSSVSSVYSVGKIS